MCAYRLEHEKARHIHGSYHILIENLCCWLLVAFIYKMYKDKLMCMYFNIMHMNAQGNLLSLSFNNNNNNRKAFIPKFCHDLTYDKCINWWVWYT